MKIEKLKINTYRGLENLDFDFKYPADYKDQSKAGKPLDKICFIGQSASGKTSLLDLIYELSLSITNLETIKNKTLTNFRNRLSEFDGEVNFKIDNDILIQKNNIVQYKDHTYKNQNSGGVVTPLLPSNLKKNILYLKSNLVSEKNIEIFTKSPIELLEKYNEIKNNLSNSENENYGYLFDSNINSELWIFLLSEILDYRKAFTQKMSELIHKGFIADENRLSTEFKKWQKGNPNAIKSFAEKLNPILDNLFLEVDLINTEYTIPISNKKNSKVIPIQSTSTGTKGLLLSFLPLYKLETIDSIILIDEPERSLYPDMQIGLMEHYFSMAKSAQFIVATHSPFIAASFEPEERFILYFDDKGNVKLKQGKSPIGDDPNDLLKNDFGIDYYNKHGKEAYHDYLRLKQKVSKEKDESKKKKLMLEMVKLGDDYNF